MKIMIRSFGFIYNHKLENEKYVLVVDCLRLPDPALVFGISKSGLDPEIQSYLDSRSQIFLKKVKDKIKDWLSKRTEPEVIIYFGCVGGLHRSVYMADKIGKWLRKLGYEVKVRHLDKSRYKYRPGK
jgi:UPF0042 nucleotide-binding protein